MDDKLGHNYFALLRTIYDMAHGTKIEAVDSNVAAAGSAIAPDTAEVVLDLLDQDDMIVRVAVPGAWVRLTGRGALFVSAVRSLSLRAKAPPVGTAL